MPAAPMTPCKRCGKAHRNANGYCADHQGKAKAAALDYYAQRNASPIQRLYQTQQWKELRRAQLRAQPLCCYCAKEHRVALATVCDHIKPHRGNESLFYDPANLQSLCKRCHDSTKQREEKRATQ